MFTTEAALASLVGLRTDDTQRACRNKKPGPILHYLNTATTATSFRMVAALILVV